MDRGSLSCTAFDDFISAIGYGPIRFSDNFFEGRDNLRFSVSSHTLSPTWYFGGSPR